MAVAILSTVTAMALFGMSSVFGAGQLAADQRNAQQLCQTHAAARAAGVEFRSATPEGLLEELSAGVRGQGVWSAAEFRFHVDPDNRRAVVRRCEYDAATGTLTLRGSGPDASRRLKEQLSSDN